MTGQTPDLVEYVVSDGVGWIWLNRPHRLNAVVPQLVEDLCRALEAAEADGVGAVVLAGRGRAFCSGYDLREEQPEEDFDDWLRRAQRLQDVTRRMRGAPHPVIAAVHGYALGAGCEFALAADLVVAASDAEFGFPEVGAGLSVSGGVSHTLPRAVGLVRAKELLFLGEHVSAARAFALGLVNAVVPAERLEAEATALAERLRDRPRTALTLAKRVLDHGAQSSLAEALDREVDHARIASGSQDAADAADRFRRRSSAALPDGADFPEDA